MYRIGIDVGGTFTDLAAVDERGTVVIAKSASTPRDPSDGLMEGLGLLAAELGLDLAGLLARTESIIHGTTVATNALLERKGARVGLLTTQGHRDVIEASARAYLSALNRVAHTAAQHVKEVGP